MKKLLEKLKKPKGLTLVLTYLLTALFIALSMVMLFVDYEGNILSVIAYTAFGCAGVSLGYTVYTLVIYAPGMKGRILSLLSANEFTRRLLHNWGYRTIISSTVTFFIGIINSAFNAYLGISERSIWFGALAAYYIFLALMRAGLLIYHRKKRDFESEALLRGKKYTRCGLLLLILNAALSSAIAQMIFDDRGFEYKDWLIYAFAAYAFYKITMSIINAVKARRQDDLTIQAIREINIVDAAVSILALQTALLHTFGTDGVNVSLFNTLTGSAVSIFSMALSVYMIVKGHKTVKEIKTKNAKG